MVKTVRPRSVAAGAPLSRDRGFIRRHDQRRVSLGAPAVRTHRRYIVQPVCNALLFVGQLEEFLGRFGDQVPGEPGEHLLFGQYEFGIAARGEDAPTTLFGPPPLDHRPTTHRRKRPSRKPLSEPFRHRILIPFQT
ncbi:hypothetical protein ABT061_02795 [Streptosporangium sp. NPDC002544]|uniref:hypothetical protein n=1 Tax=Streptosporangium sp. NPDC002544 TaxID=3154538 RepID=UPI0033173D93